MRRNSMNVNELIGKTVKSIKNNNNKELIFECSNERKYRLFHEQDCCEDVSIEDICGELSDLVCSPILQAEEITNELANPFGIIINNKKAESFTYTFYKFGTIKGYVTLRWYGTSNGCYNEKVDFEEIIT
jgi:hypothetical protein